MKLLLKTLQLFSNKDFKTWLIDSSASGQCLPFQLHLFHRSPLPLYTSYSNHGQVLYMQFSYYYHNLSCPLHKLVPLFGVGYYSFIITQHPEHWPNLEQVLTICHGNPNYSAGTPALFFSSSSSSFSSFFFLNKSVFSHFLCNQLVIYVIV